MISILIPAHNESPRLGATLAALRTLRFEEPVEIIVVDDGSTDDTAAIADSGGADTVIRQVNAGKGAALTAAYGFASGDFLLLIDADLGETAVEAVKLIGPVLSGEADMVIAAFRRRSGRRGGMGAVVRLARWGIRRLTGAEMASPLSGQRALRRAVLERSGGFAEGWGVEIALTVRAIAAGFRVQEVITEMDHRVTGRSTADIAHRAAQFKAALGVLFGLWWWRSFGAGRRASVDARRA